ncbi:MAG: DPP IV N-terminal domain-containing protein [Thermomicrobiales bacterium]
MTRRTLLAASTAAPGALALGGAAAKSLAPSAPNPRRIPRAAARQDGKRPIENLDTARLPAPGMNMPASVSFSPDGTQLTYLVSEDSSLVQQLWAYDIAAGTETILLGIPEDATPGEHDFGFWEQMFRERQRNYTFGVTSYAWGDTGAVLMARRMGEVLVRIGDAWITLPDSRDWADPQISPDETHIAFVHDGEVHVLDLADPYGAPRRLTDDASPTDPMGDQPITNGLAEYWVQEELGRTTGLWWSPDSSRLLFAQADASAVPRYVIPHQGIPAVSFETTRYARPGDPIARVRLGMVPAAGGEVQWLTEPDDRGYLLRADWTPDGQLVTQWLTRDNTSIILRRIDPMTGESVALFTETLKPWVTATDDLRFIREPGGESSDYRILWSSERSGWRELYLYDRDGAELAQVTDGDVRIDGVSAVDARDGWVAVTGWKETPLESQLYRVPLAGGPAEQLTDGPGTHTTAFGAGKTLLADRRHSAAEPPTLTIRERGGKTIGTVATIPDPLLDELDLVPPEFVEIPAEDGSIMYGALYRPRGLAAGKKAPVIIAAYGGPGSQRVTDGWTATSDLRPEALGEQGFLVLKLDNRGTARRGREWETITYQRSGEIELRDQLTGVEWLAANVPEADTGRVGIYGWSYGGYMTLLALSRAPEVFKVGAAGSPAVDWHEYDAPYTERYFGLPQDHPEVYTTTSALTDAPNITGKLLLNHGMIDENVHFRHSARLVNEALNPAGVDYEFLVFPEQRHHLRSESDRLVYENRAMAMLTDNL